MGSSPKARFLGVIIGGANASEDGKEDTLNTGICREAAIGASEPSVSGARSVIGSASASGTSLGSGLTGDDASVVGESMDGVSVRRDKGWGQTACHEMHEVHETM